MGGKEPTGPFVRPVAPEDVSVTGWWIEPSGRIAYLDSIKSHSFSRHLAWASVWLQDRGQNPDNPIDACKLLGCIRVSNLGIGGCGLFFDYDPCCATPQALMAAARLLAQTAAEFDLWIIGDDGDPDRRIVTDRRSTAAAFLVAAAKAARVPEEEAAEPQAKQDGMMRF